MMGGFTLPFPPIAGLTFEPHQDHLAFCLKYGVGITLLHSHDGFSELTYTNKMTKSRPAIAEDKINGMPVSFFINESGDLVPYEWVLDFTASDDTNQLRPLPSQAHDQKFACELLALATSSKVPLGITVQNFENGRNEVEAEATEPGCHSYYQDGNTDGFTTTIVDVDLTDFGKPAFQPKEAKCDPRANSHRRDGQGKPAFKPKEAKCDPRANSHRRDGQDKPAFQPKEAKCDPRANSHRRDGQGKPAFKPKEAKCDPRANSHRRDGQGKTAFQQTN